MKLLFGVCLALLAATMVVEDFASADDTTYYVDAASGNDSKGGTSTTRAWRTIDRANALDLKTGDRLLFRGGQTFVGNLLVGAEDAGTAASPVEVGSYGTGRARISAGTGTGVSIYNAGGIEVSRLLVSGAGRAAGNRASGVEIYTDRMVATKFEHVRVFNVEVSGFGDAGVLLGADPADAPRAALGMCGSRVSSPTTTPTRASSPTEASPPRREVGHTRTSTLAAAARTTTQASQTRGPTRAAA